MSTLDWIVMAVVIFATTAYGVWKTRGSQNIENYLLGGNEAKWWTIGLSVMATQASAITFLSTPGQAYFSGMEFLQFYFALPVAMVIICITFIPIFYKLKVFTAYEFLEERFDVKTRVLTSGLFLVQRGLAAGITIYAPAIIVSSIMGWNLSVTTIFIGSIAVLYTVTGGTKAVHVTHKLQMVIILLSLFIIFFLLLSYMPDQYTFSEILSVPRSLGKLDIIKTEFSWTDRYNIWTSIAALFLFLSYFGTDQSQVQRYISGNSVRDSRLGLIFNGFFKVPLQFFILFLGILVFLFYQFRPSPIFFNEAVTEKIEQSDTPYSGQLSATKAAFSQNFAEKELLISKYISKQRSGQNFESETKALQDNYAKEIQLREEAKQTIKAYDGAIETNDKDYLFINFILNNIPKGLVGLLLAVIFFAAMSSTSAELNALSSTTTVDIYKRLLKRNESPKEYLMASRLITLMWGSIAILFAATGSLFENLIQFVNIIGSLFYGSILGIFLVAFYFKSIKANAVFIAAILAELVVIAFYKMDIVSFLWLNLIGSVAVIIFSFILQNFFFNGRTDVSK